MLFADYEPLMVTESVCMVILKLSDLGYFVLYWRAVFYTD